MFAALLLVAATATGIASPADPLRITPAEKAACTQDATRLCSGTYPDEARLLECMKANRAALSAACGTAFDAGVRRRGL